MIYIVQDTNDTDTPCIVSNIKDKHETRLF